MKNTENTLGGKKPIKIENTPIGCYIDHLNYIAKTDSQKLGISKKEATKQLRTNIQEINFTL